MRKILSLKLQISVFLILFISSCSSKPKRSYKVFTLEQRADEYMVLADKYRLEKRLKESSNYYKQAEKIYFLKGNKRKYVIAILKNAILMIKENKIKSAKKIISYAKNFNQQENLKLEVEIAGVELRFFESTKQREELNKLISWIMNNVGTNLEKKSYYKSIMIDKVFNFKIDSKLEESFKDDCNELRELYSDGKISNTEGFIKVLLIEVEYLIKNNYYNQAIRKLSYIENKVSDMEMVSQFERIYKRYIDIYQAMGQGNLVEHYRNNLNLMSKIKL